MSLQTYCSYILSTFGIRQWQCKGGDAEYLVKPSTVTIPPLVDSLEHLLWILGRRPKNEKRVINSIMSLLILYLFIYLFTYWHFLLAGDL